MFDAAVLDERQGLKHLDRRADESRQGGISGGCHDRRGQPRAPSLLRGPTDDDVDTMDRLDESAATNFDDQRVHARGIQTSATSWIETEPRFGLSSTRSNGSVDASYDRRDVLHLSLEVGGDHVARFAQRTRRWLVRA